MNNVNLLAGLSTGLGAIFYLIVLKIYGVSKATDELFYLLTTSSLMSIVPQIFWGGFIPHYVNDDRDKKIKIIKFIILVNVSLCGLFLIFDLFAQLEKFNFILKLILFFQIFNDSFKKVCIASERINVSYVADIINWTISCIAVILIGEKINPAFSIVLGLFLSFIFLFIKNKDLISIHGLNDFSEIGIIIKESLILKIGSLLYLCKDFILANILTAMLPGVYSLFVYANKMAMMIFATFATPVIEKYGSIPEFKSKFKNANIFCKFIVKNVMPKLVLVNLIVLFAIYFLIKLNFASLIKINNDILQIYIIMSIISVVYLFEHSYNKYYQSIRYFKSINLINILCLIFYSILYFFSQKIVVNFMEIGVCIILIHTSFVIMFIKFESEDHL